MANFRSISWRSSGPCLLLVLLSGCVLGPPAIQGSGVSKTETRTVAEFTEVELSSAVHLDLTVGPAAHLEVTTDDNLLPHVTTEVVDGRLKIGLSGRVSTNLGILVKATTPSLTALDGSGATQTQLTGVRGRHFRLALSGASQCNFKGKPARLDLEVSGASHCTLTGEADRLTVSTSGASGVGAAGFCVREVEVTASGASKVEVRATKELTANASGASKVRYLGTPAKVHQDASGASSIGPE
jgi:hypothetical protein